LIRRLIASVPVIVLVAVIAFSILHIVPGDPVAILIGNQEEYNEETAKEIKARLGLDKPIPFQFLSWFGGLFKGNLGSSIFTGHSVFDLIKPKLPVTFSLAMMGLALAVVVGIPMGVAAAWNYNKTIDRAVMVFAVIGFAVPGFWLAFNLIWLFAVKLSWFTVIGCDYSHGVGGFLRSMTLPTITLGVAFMALIARMTRSSMLEVLREDYIRTARAKGLRERLVMMRHALKPASIPVTTIIGLAFAGAITGVVVTETVYSCDGVGRMVVNAVTRRDFPIIQGVMVLFAASYVLVNLLVDVVYAYLDPRIRY
jgi:peptide/nickel transport system permease protein